MMLLLALLVPWAAKAQETLTVYEDETGTNSYIPIYGTWADVNQQSEFIIPAEELADIIGGNISKLTYHVYSKADKLWGGTAKIYLKEVSETSFETPLAYYGTEGATIVYEGELDAYTSYEMDVPFTVSYTYGGGNLLVGLIWTTGGKWGGATFYGKSFTDTNDPYTAIYSYGGGSINGQKFIPRVTFTYEPASTGCDMPTAIAVSNITPTGAQVTWEGEGNAWNLRYKASTDADYTLVEGLTTMSYTLGSLTENTAYSVGVQTVCSGSTSSFRSTSFTTANPCAAPTNLQISDITASSATLTWTAGYQETNWTVKYKKSSETDWTSETVTGTPTLNLRGLEGLTTYNVQVYNCESYVSGNFTTAASFPYAQDFSGGTSLPTGWKLYTGAFNDETGTATLSSASYGWSVGTSNAVLDGNNAYANIYSTGCYKWMVTPAIPMPAGARITFDVAYTAYSGTAANPQTTGTDDRFIVLASTDNMATWTVLRKWDNAGSEYVLNDLTPTTLSLNFDMADYAGTDLIIAFYAESTVSNTDNNIHVDNVVFELVPDCERPTNLAVNYEGGTSATFTWTENGTATSWDLQYSTDAEFTTYTQQQVDGTPTYELTGLELATTYYVRVNAFCGTPSDYSNIVSFSTDFCMPENQCELTITLTDAYGDGGGNIQVVDVLTNEVLGSFTNSGESTTYTLAVCDGRELNFVYASTDSWSYENGWVITDINNEIISEHVGCTSSGSCDAPTNGVIANYTVNCTITTCLRPTDLAASEIGKRSAVLSWTENGEATAWQVEVTDLDGGQVTTWDANATTYEIVGLTPDTRYSVRVKPDCEEEKWSDAITFRTEVACPAPAALEVVPTPISATVTWTGDASNYNLRYGTCAEPDPTQPVTIIFHADAVWQDGSGYQMLLDADATAYGTIIPETGGLTSAGDATDDVYAEFEYKIPANADGSCTTSNVVVDNTITLQIPAGTYDWCITNPTPGDRIWIASAQGNVGGRANDYVFEGGMTYEFHIYLLGQNDAVDVTIMCSNVDWTTVNNATSPYTINGLDPETEYYVGVQAVCGGEDGESAWTTTSFTTPSACDAPVNLEATDLTYNSATLNWTGYQDSYNVRYRTAGFDGYYINETFDGEIGNWTVSNLQSGSGLFSGAGVDGSVCFGFYYTTNPPQYLISPVLAAGAGGKTLTFSYKASSSYYSESFKVGFANGEETSFEEMTWEDEVTTEGTDWLEYQTTIPEGTSYFVIQCTSYDAYYLLVDNFVIYDENAIEEAGEWVDAVATTNSLDITGLTPETNYEWQVQGINPSCTETEGLTEWSEIATFTTLEQTTVTQTIALSAGVNWFSTYVDISLSALQGALVTALPGATLIRITAQNGSATTYNGTRWRGSLNSAAWDVSRMYTIEIQSDAELSLEGEPVDPAEHSINIAPGNNWIGFPLGTGMTVSDAFAGFAIQNDKVNAQNGKNTTYNGTRWRGTMTTLEPGQGYVFYGAGTESRTFVYPTPSKRVVGESGGKPSLDIPQMLEISKKVKSAAPQKGAFEARIKQGK